MSTLDVVLGAVVMALGACLQGAVGFGANLVAAPVLLLVSPRFMPGPIVMATSLLSVLVGRREGRGAIDPNIKVAIIGQVAGGVVAAVTIASLPDRGLSILFGVIVLVGVALAAGGWALHPTRRTLVGAGVASAFMGTVSGIGGPPIALVYQRAELRTFRATLARFFLAGSVVSVVALAVVGRIGRDEVAPTLALLPAVVIGFALSRRLARRLDGAAARPIVLVLSTISAIAVLVREVV